MTERDLFLAAIDLPDPAARARHLRRACGADAALRGRVEALLRSHEQAGDFLAVPAVALPAPDHAATRAFVPTPDPDEDPTAGDSGRPEPAPDPLAFLAPPGRPGSLGRIGHYEVLQVLGRGGFGVVFRAFDEALQRVVAVKVLAPLLAVTPAARKRFLREARASARVRHENVVQVYEAGELPLPYLVMEYIPGETLQQRLDQAGPLDPAEVARVGRQLADGLDAAHEHGLVHRDVKPTNVLLESGPRGHVKLTDFGLARAADDATLTHSGQVAGTPMYMAPEQAKGEHVDHRADLFSLGSVLYVMTTGRPPFRAQGALAVLRRVAEDDPPPVRDLAPETPGWLCDLIGKLHAKDPADRFPSAREVADLLARHLADREPAHPSVDRGPPARMRAGGPRSRRLVAALAAAVLLLLGGLGFSEAAGVTNVRGTVIRLLSPEGTLVVEVDDPGVSVKVDGSDLVITGAGVQEIRLKAGRHTVEATKGGKLVRQELVTVERNGRRVVRVSQEPPDAKAAGTAPKPIPADAVAWERVVAGLSAEQQVQLVTARLKDLNPAFGAGGGRVTHKIEGGVVTELALHGQAKDTVTDISPMRALPGLKSFECDAGDRLSDLSPLKGLKLTRLHVDSQGLTDLSPLADVKLTSLSIPDAGVADLSPLKGMASLRSLDITMTKVSDLSPLTGLRLTSLVCYRTGVSDLSPLRGMPLAALVCFETPVSDLSPLRGMPLKRLLIYRTGVTDLRPLAGMPLEEVLLTPADIARGLDVLRGMKSLKTVGVDYNPQPSGEPNHWPAAEFWARHDRGEFRREAGLGVRPAPDAATWEKGVAGLPAVEQVKDVARRLQELNPGFDGAVESAVENGVVRGLAFSADHVLDLSPVRALPGLRSLACSGSDAFKGQLVEEANGTVKVRATGKTGLSDLSPLKGLPLTSVSCVNSNVYDLTPLRGMKLTSLRLGSSLVYDLSPLKGMPLTELDCGYTKVADLAPLRGMRLTRLVLDGTPAADLTPLKGMPLTHLSVGPAVTDLAPLKGMPLHEFACNGSGVSDVAPLKGMPLGILSIADTKVTDLSPLAGMTTLRRLYSSEVAADLSPLKGLPLEYLHAGPLVTDLSPLKGMPLDTLQFAAFRADRDAAVLRALKTLKTINDQPAAEFWRGVEGR
ncbi:MAG: protein kinase [Gemmataceae bacterium]|nr:protein kinase [Gemmataceae bacterium]